MDSLHTSLSICVAYVERGIVPYSEKSFARVSEPWQDAEGTVINTQFIAQQLR